MLCEGCIHEDVCGLEGYYEEALMYCSHYVNTKWIPINSINDLPKDKKLFVTLDNRSVDTLYYDSTEWSSKYIAEHTIAYMEYYEYTPNPYQG